MRACTNVHTAVLQVLMATQPKITAFPEEPFLARWIAPAMKLEA